MRSLGSIKNRTDRLGRRQGLWEFYYANGNIWFKGLYKNDECNGYSEYYYPNGKLRLKGLYLNDRRNGIFENYYEDGSLKCKELYENGDLIKVL
jgi:antitoxin component YwqK of YwqJK toxin-antitoxin module